MDQQRSKMRNTYGTFGMSNGLISYFIDSFYSLLFKIKMKQINTRGYVWISINLKICKTIKIRFVIFLFKIVKFHYNIILEKHKILIYIN